VHLVSVTPFLPDEALDGESLRSLVEFSVAAGCDGMLILGVMGEADRLSDAERDQVIETVIAQNDGRLQITVGVTAGSTVVARQRAIAAARSGADAVMVSPPPGSAAGPVLREHFQRIAEGLPLPVVIQDHPASSGVKLTADFIASLLDVVPAGSAVKLEDPPTPPKIARLKELAPRVPIFGGLGGVALASELDAGASGTMTGFAFPETLLAIVRAHRAGEVDTARRLFVEALPMMLFESQPGIAAGLRKEILRRRGAIRHATVRQPAPTLDATTLAELERVMGS
jgi:4-hydroxy-tetrahydrodipicolinate synthase